MPPGTNWADFVLSHWSPEEWDRLSDVMPEMLEAVGRAMGFDASLPVREIPPAGMDAVWNGLTEPITVLMNCHPAAKKARSLRR